MRIGKCYIVHCGDWHSYVGRCSEQIGTGAIFEFDKASKIHETNNGDCWEKLAAGDKQLRAACTYRHHTTPTVIPLVIAAIEWLGNLPQEEGYPG